MMVQVPENQLYGSALVMGLTQIGTTESLRMAIILKAAYDIENPTGGARQMTPADDPSRVGIVFADQGEHIFIDAGGVDRVIQADALLKVSADENGDAVPNTFTAADIGKVYFEFNGGNHLVETEAANQHFLFDLHYEADIALDKARADIVVKGHRSGTTDGSVVVAGDVWLTRNPTPSPRRDVSRNLFGWHPKTQADRNAGLSTSYDPHNDGDLPIGFASKHNNFHRNGDQFSFTGDVAAQLPSTAQVDVFKTADASGEAYSFSLPEFDLTARYRFHDGAMPDHEHCWPATEIGPMRADTLIVEPDDNRATILWRASWAADAQPFDAYRRVEITHGGG
jgi:hypothetical protein